MAFTDSVLAFEALLYASSL